MMFQNPLWLWSLAGLVVPLGIHLLNRKEGPVWRVGSIRHLEESDTKQFRSLKLNELWLLALRMLLIVIVAFILSGLSCSGRGDGGGKWLLVEADLMSDEKLLRFLDSVSPEFERRTFAAGFPLWRDSAVSDHTSHWALLQSRRLSALDSAVIITRRLARNFSGPAEQIPAHIHWVGWPSGEARSTVHKVRADSIWERNVVTSPEVTSFSWSKRGLESQKNAVGVRDIKVRLVAGSGYRNDAAMFTEVLKAIETVTPFTFSVDSVGSEHNTHFDWHVYLTDERPDSVEQNSIGYATCADEELLLPFGHGRCGTYYRWNITRRIDATAVAEQRLVSEVALIMIPEAKDNIIDNRVLPEYFLSRAGTRESQVLATSEDSRTQQWLVGLLMLLIIAERITAYLRGQ